ncbi:DUF5908 family protein [Aliifodinibius sp. S!AR15-10]|uniref:DUF5908 family protein n=1 Tax=Aliifodinibius sp. S!AR15-10 TaxID=2950437 RepID=UPI00285C86B0|nr:DUF5908 family protein [Aliifodinibius sp. S!AR15-10]MDR8390616.1 DUF5908 family protein [Aliifodinibius sp. S!AR15-10]
MPIEIKELVIRATIDTEKSSSKGRTYLSGDDKEKSQINKLTQRVEELQKMIKQKNER